MHISITAKITSKENVLIKCYSCQINITTQNVGLQFMTDRF